MSAKTKNEMLFSEFPLPEYHQRYERLIAYGKDQNIDAFIFTDEENLRYFAGGPLTDAFLFRPDYMAVIIPTNREKAPRFVLSRTKINSVHSSWIKDRYFWGDVGIESAGDITVEAMVSSIRDLALERGTIAMEISGNEKLFMSASTYDDIRKQLPEMNIVSCFSAVSTVRGVKSSLEIEYIREACRITTEAIEHGFSITRAGVTEKDISRAIKSKMYELGADDVPFLAVLGGLEGRGICWDSYATDYAIKPGDPIQVDGGCSVKGYLSDMVRTASLGPIKNSRYLELYDATLRAHYAVRDLLRPGAVIHDICEAGRMSIVNDGYEDLLLFGTGQTGHGFGVGIHEEPFLVPSSQKVLEPGMVLAIEPPIMEYADLERATYFTILENNYLITETGYEQLTNSPNEIRVI